MDLALLKRVADDGVAKHKAFLELQEALDGAAGITQYINELQVEARSLKDQVAHSQAKISEAQQSVQQAQMLASRNIADINGRVAAEAAKHDSNIQALRAESDGLTRKLAELQSTYAAQSQSFIEAQRIERKEAIAKKDAELSLVKTEIARWQDKLASAKAAYEKFISTLPK